MATPTAELNRLYRRWKRADAAMQAAIDRDDLTAQRRVMERTLYRRASKLYSFGRACMVGRPEAISRDFAPIHWTADQWSTFFNTAAANIALR